MKIRRKTTVSSMQINFISIDVTINYRSIDITLSSKILLCFRNQTSIKRINLGRIGTGSGEVGQAPGRLGTCWENVGYCRQIVDNFMIKYVCLINRMLLLSLWSQHINYKRRFCMIIDGAKLNIAL